MTAKNCLIAASEKPNMCKGKPIASSLAAHDSSLKRVMIVGGPGSGKTWLADVMGKRLGLPVYSVDDAVWDEHGHLRPAPEIDDIVRALSMQGRWIIESGNTRTYAERARRADIIIWLMPPQWIRVYRILCREGLKLELLR